MTLRILYDNAADRYEITASSVAGSLIPSNMQTDRKSEVYRSSGTSTTLTLTSATANFVNMVALVFTNLTSSATMRVRTYTNEADVTPIKDSGIVSAQAPDPLGEFDWGNVPFGINAYSYYGAGYGRCYLENSPVKKVVIDIVDTTNPSGYIEISRLVVGKYFTPDNDAEMGMGINVVETSKKERSNASDLVADLGTKSKKINFDLAHMTESDRAQVYNILRGNGITKSLFISLFPEDVNPNNEQTYQIYGKLSQQSAVALSYWSAYSTTIEIEES